MDGVYLIKESAIACVCLCVCCFIVMDVVSDSNSKVSCNWAIEKLTASLDGHVLFFYQRDNISCEHGKERVSCLSLTPQTSVS